MEFYFFRKTIDSREMKEKTIYKVVILKTISAVIS